MAFLDSFNAMLTAMQNHNNRQTFKHLVDVLTDVNGETRGGLLGPNTWTNLPGIYKARINGVGNITVDAMDAMGNVTLGAFTFVASGPRDEYPFLDSAVAFRATLTGTATIEIV